MNRIKVYLKTLWYFIRNINWTLDEVGRGYLSPKFGPNVWWRFRPNKAYALGFKKSGDEEMDKVNLNDLYRSALDSFPPKTPFIIYEEDEYVRGAYTPGIAADISRYETIWRDEIGHDNIFGRRILWAGYADIAKRPDLFISRLKISTH